MIHFPQQKIKTKSKIPVLLPENLTSFCFRFTVRNIYRFIYLLNIFKNTCKVHCLAQSSSYIIISMSNNFKLQ